MCDTDSLMTEMSPETDLAGLLLAVASEDREAFTRLYKQTSRLLYGVALRITRQPEMADDALSETYLQVWRQARNYDVARGSVIAWLTVICRSRSLDVLRSRRAEPAVGASTHVEMEALGHGPVDLLGSVEARSRLHTALWQLEEQQRQLLALAYFKGYSHSEIASHLGVPLGTVKSQLRRGVEKLRLLMDGESHG